MKRQPVFSLDRRCSAAMRRIAAFIEERIEAEKASMASEFAQQRRVGELRSVTPAVMETRT